MARRRHGQRAPYEIWPGFVDALTTLLLVIIFLLVVFVLAQFFLSQALSGRDAALHDAYLPASVSDAELAATVLPALDRHRDFLLNWIENAPQTNEIRRSAALIPALHWLSARHPGLPLHLSELGASAGLNLMCDRFALDTTPGRLGPADPALSLSPDWTGPLPPEMPVTVASRRGVDLNPLDPADPGDALRLTAYLWADQAERIARTRRAMAVASAQVDRGDAAAWIETRMAGNAQGVAQMIYTTVAWQYFPEETQARVRRAIEAAVNKASPLPSPACHHRGCRLSGSFRPGMPSSSP